MKSPLIAILTLLFLNTLSPGASASGFWEEDIWKSQDRGFYYYEPEKEKETTPEPQKFIPTPLSSFTTIEEVKAEREKRLAAAVMNPTDENMASYLEVNHFVQEKSAFFADKYRRALWNNPQFDFTTENPAANFAQVLLKGERDQTKEKNMHAIAKNWGLVYFFKDSCSYCKMQSPLIKMLADKFGFEILPISLDGIPNEHFPDALPDNGIGKKLTRDMGVQKVPALFIVNREQTESHLVSSGVLALEDMIHRIETIAAKKPGESLFGGSEVALTGAR